MDVQFVLLGSSPLLCHNPVMVDPQFDLNRQIKALTSKKKKTDEDFAEIERLEWFGGIYTGIVGGRAIVTQPTSKIRKCLIGAARINKQGKQIERAITMTSLDTALIYSGSDRVKDLQPELERLQSSREFNSRLSVGVNGKRVMRIRPQFSPWGLIVDAVFLDDAGLNFDELERIVELAGKAERIGDNRINGYGAFRGAVIKLGSHKIVPTIAGLTKFFENLDEAAEAA